MMLFTLPFLGIGTFALVVLFVKRLRHNAGVGPTLVEISDHPLVPGHKLSRVSLTDGQPEAQVGRYLPDVRGRGRVQPRHERPH